MYVQIHVILNYVDLGKTSTSSPLLLARMSSFRLPVLEAGMAKEKLRGASAISSPPGQRPPGDPAALKTRYCETRSQRNWKTSCICPTPENSRERRLWETNGLRLHHQKDLLCLHRQKPAGKQSEQK